MIAGRAPDFDMDTRRGTEEDVGIFIGARLSRFLPGRENGPSCVKHTKAQTSRSS